ncbi:hypothetical protein [Flavobacterium sp.]|uniref:hypothetical protein n=2 Tax=Flavobacterium sp. TaxID=239 RepID=UPI004047C918
MKVIEFIKKNVSIFTIISLLLFVITIHLIWQEFNFNSISFYEVFKLKLQFLIVIVILLFLDYFLKILIKNRLILNLLELIIIASVYIFYYFK